MPEPTLKESIERLQDTILNIQYDIKDSKSSVDNPVSPDWLAYQKRTIEALSFAISKLSLLEQVEKGFCKYCRNKLLGENNV